MLVDDLIVEVRDGSYIRQGQFVEADLGNFLVVPRANSIGSWSIDLPDSIQLDDGTFVPHPLCLLLRTPASGIVVTDPTGVILSGPMRSAIHNSSTDDPGGTWTLSGVSDATIIAECEAWPQPSNSDGTTQTVANDVRTAVAETLLYQFLSANVGPTASAARKNPVLSMGTNLARGPLLTKSPRYQNMLELFQEITAGTDLLFDVVQVGNLLQLRTWMAADLTADIRMDIANNQLDSLKYQYAAPGVSVVNVLGQDQGTARQFVQRTSAASLAAAALWGVRIEKTLDQRQTSNVTELQQAGDEDLANEGDTITSLQIVPSDDQQQSFDVGDYVTVVVGTQQVSAQVTEKPIQVSAGSGVFVGATVGDPYAFDWESLIDGQVTDLTTRVSAIERTVEVPPVVALVAAAVSHGRNLFINPGNRTNQDGYVSGANIPIGSYAFDGVKASGVLNLVTNPSAEGTLTYSGNSLTLTKDSSWAQFRTNSFKLVATGTADCHMSIGENQAPSFFGLTAGKTYTVSGYCKVVTPTSGTAVSPAARVRSISVIGIQSGVTFEANSAQAVNTAGTITRVSVTFTVPPGTTSGVHIRFYLGSSVGTVQWDGLMLTEGPILYPYFDGSTSDCSWSGTTDASVSYNAPNVVPTLTGTFDPNFGSLFTINTNGRISQIVERSRVPAGTYTIAHGGTATLRVYKNTTAPASRPAFAAGPITFVSDGSDDVVVEFSGGGAGATFGQARMFAGSTDFGFALPTLGDELRDCQRYYHRYSGGYGYQMGVMTTTTSSVIPVLHNPPMRATPVFSFSSLLISELVTTETAVTAGSVYWGINNDGASSYLTVAHAAFGAANRPVALVLRGGWFAFDARIR